MLRGKLMQSKPDIVPVRCDEVLVCMQCCLGWIESGGVCIKSTGGV